MPDIIEIKAQIQWVTYKDMQSGQWIGVCEPLRLTALGETHSDLLEAISDAQEVLFRDLLIEDELHSFLRARGWELTGKIPHDPQSGDYRFDVPIEVLINHERTNGEASALRQ